MKKYVFITNSTKPSEQVADSLTPIKLSNVEKPCIKCAIELGYQVILGVNRTYAEKLECEGYSLNFYNSHTYRNIFAFKDNYKAYKNLCEILKQGDVEVIHCNTPIGGMVGRICGRKYKIPKIIYTAHGFHFYKGAPLFNNTILKWAEQIMAHWTDVIITMNEEDYQAAKKMKLKKDGKVYKINGVGINVEEYQNIKVDKVEKRKTLGLSENDFVCIAMGDLIKRKKFEMAIRGIAMCEDRKIHYIICGEGPELNNLKKIAYEMGVRKQIHFLGFRSDIKELLAISDLFLFTSSQEGLPRSLMEAMAFGLPCIVSDVRGNKDLITNKKCLVKTSMDVKNSIEWIIKNQGINLSLSKENRKKIQSFDITHIEKIIVTIYKENLLDESINI